MLGYTQPYPIPDKSNSTPYIKNGFICYVPSQNKIMPRHDCIWNSTEETGLSNPEPNTSNKTDNFTSTEEEFDYDILGITSEESAWDPDLVKLNSLPLTTDDSEQTEVINGSAPPQSEPMVIVHPQRNDDTIELPPPPSTTRTKRNVKYTTKFAEFINTRKPKADKAKQATANNTNPPRQA